MTPSPLTHDCPHTNRSRRAIDCQQPPSRQIANFVRPHTANVAAQSAATPPIVVFTARTIAPTLESKLINPSAAIKSP
jgi:hypothetical protein